MLAVCHKMFIKLKQMKAGHSDDGHNMSVSFASLEFFGASRARHAAASAPTCQKTVRKPTQEQLSADDPRQLPTLMV